MKFFKITCFLLIMICAFSSVFADTKENTSVERFALYVASNDGGRDRETLRYAGSDALQLKNTMEEIGGIKAENGVLLVDPQTNEIQSALSSISSKIKDVAKKTKRTEFIFYYSGHSDENALLLGNAQFDYSSLKAAINNVPSDVHVVLLDSCFSGNFIRAKGGSRQKSFLVDDSTIVQGHAYLSSSSESESSQESDEIEASFFTHSLITGLRGAADASGDNKVSLNELYYYAFNDTLSNTEKSSSGPQHPSYNITLVGSGDLVLTDISEAEATLILPSDAEGKYLIRTSKGKLVSEVNKVKGNQLVLALQSGTYSITVITGSSTNVATVTLKRGSVYAIEDNMLKPVTLAKNRERGNKKSKTVKVENVFEDPERIENVFEDYEEEDDDDDDFFDDENFDDPDVDEILDEARKQYRKSMKEASKEVRKALKETKKENKEDDDEEEYDYDDEEIIEFKEVDDGDDGDTTISFPFGITISNKETSHLSINLFMGFDKNVSGLQLNSFMGTIAKNLSGSQLSGFMNIVGGSSKGMQAAGFMNTSRSLNHASQFAGFMNIASAPSKGSQFSGFMNVAKSGLDGYQAAGFMNIAGSSKLCQMSSFMNIANGKSSGAQFSGFMNIADDFKGFQLGIINIADSNDGVSIGLINIIKDGVCSPAVYYEGDKNYFLQYQGGTHNLFSTYMIGTDKDFSNKYYVLGYGLGSRIGKGFLSMDIELLYKQILDASYLETELNKALEEAARTGETKIMATEINDYTAARIMPGLRLTLNCSLAKHLSFFVAVQGDVYVKGWNEAAFSYWEHESPYSFNIGQTEVGIYPSISFGLKF